MEEEYKRDREFLKVSKILQNEGYNFIWNGSFEYTLNVIVKLNSDKRIKTKIEIIKEILLQNKYTFDKIFNKREDIIILNLNCKDVI